MKFCWCTVSVRDMEKSIAFYTKVVGLPVQRRFTAGSGLEICFLGDGETKVELISAPAPSAAGHSEGVTLGFLVASLEAQMEVSAQHGYPVERGPIQPNPSMRFCYVRDPDGVPVQFVQNL
jgi:lactoylglutathione lyase